MIEMDPVLINEMAMRGKRIDGRPFDAYRDVKIETGIITSAEGSAHVKLGETEVIVGVKLEVGTPYPDSPDEGVLTCSAELVPLASPEFESGPPGEEAIELARVVDRAIRESKCIDMKRLCIKAGEVVWMIYVDIDVLNDDGNLIDAACIAAVAALASARLPKLVVDGDKYEVDYSVHEERLPLGGIPISTTFAKIGPAIAADPNIAEIKAMAARLTVGTIDKEREIKLCSMQKGGECGLRLEEVDKIIDMAVAKGEELREKVRAAVGT
ncbi:MAG: exosome complex protein Rrp42 [Candidatus Aenigmatarchaeota archaeon]